MFLRIILKAILYYIIVRGKSERMNINGNPIKTIWFIMSTFYIIFKYGMLFRFPRLLFLYLSFVIYSPVNLFDFS